MASKTDYTPLKVCEDTGKIARGSDGLSVLISDCRYRSEEENKAIMARAVACVNACRGINPEAVPGVIRALEAMLVGYDPSDPHPIEEQAVAALKKVRPRD